MLLLGVIIAFGACNNDDDDNGNQPPGGDGTADFTVTIENVSMAQPIFESGVFNTPVDATEPAALSPGDAYEFEINAGPVVLPIDGGTKLSFVTMFVQSNDLFFAPAEEGIALYDSNGDPIGANAPLDVTDQVLLWDAGTEVNEETGGPNQKPQQDTDAEDEGEDENGVVTQITNNTDAFGNQIPDVDEVIMVTIENIGAARFKVRIENVSTSTTIATPALGAGTTAAVPISPGVYAVHTASSPFFVEGEAASAAGLVASVEGVENIAEDGVAADLTTDTDGVTGLTIPLSPGIYVVHDNGTQPIYQSNAQDLDEGLEEIAEDGVPTTLVSALNSKSGVNEVAAFNTPDGSTTPGPIGPGEKYEFSFTASEGENLSFATMFVQSNDWFYAFSPNGIPLFQNGVAINGDFTSQVFLYDAGTEADEYPGAGLFQVIRQTALNTGDVDTNTNVRLIDPANFDNVPATASVIKVTISSTSN
ncbi:spondin domain-containing protein [Gillisia marina]|uniref:spondin domain-containing protein n=1 Tax=Gillisia marina TaxID=1167637 RepID=UPI00029B4388|nr:spondin domain-containing protein [Gillisia marina]